MGLATAHVLTQMGFELGGGSVPTELDTTGILNQAGHHLYSMHPWRWAVGRTALIDLRGILSGSTATWTAASSTLTETGGFTDYSFLAGDEITISGGTGATQGTYKIASRTSANAIVLDGSIAAGNLATGDIDWTIDPGTVALPTDLRDILWIGSTSLSAVGGITLVPLQTILDLRKASASVTAVTGLYYGAVVYSGSPIPRPILEVYPAPSANATGAMRIFYRSRWSELTGDSNQIEIPEWMYDLFIQIARAYAAGYVRNETGSLSARLAEIHAGPVFAVAKRSDGMVQPYHGQIMNGATGHWRRRHHPMAQIVNFVAPPSL